MIKKLVLLGLFVIVQSARLPSYLNQCRADANLNECYKKAANLAIPDIVKGDIHYDIPSMTPLKLSKVIYKKIDGVTVTFSNAELYGLETSKVTDVNVNLKKGKATVDVKIPKLVMTANYLIDSYFYTLPAWKAGRAVRTMDNVTLHLAGNYTVTKRDGDEYFNILSSIQDYSAENDSFEFDGIIDESGFFEEMLNGEFNTRTVKTLQQKTGHFDHEYGDFILPIFNAILNKVPANEVFKY